MINNKIVLGYIGNGKSTNRYHLPFVLQRKDKFIVKTIYNPHIHHDVWDKIEGINYTENQDDIFLDDEIDMVVVCTAHHYHYEYTKKALEHNKHCLCEKPFMENSQQAKEVFALAKEKGLYCSAYQNRRYDSDFLTVQKVIESGKLGDLLELEMHFDYYRPEIPESVDHFDPAMSYLYGHGCHTLDQVISYFGKPNDIHYDVRQLLGSGRMNDYFDLDLYYGTLKVSVKSSYFRVKSRPSFIVYGKKGMFEKYSKDRQEEHLKLSICLLIVILEKIFLNIMELLLIMMMKAFIMKKKFQQLTATMHVCMIVSMIVLFMVRNKSSNHGKQFYKWKC